MYGPSGMQIAVPVQILLHVTEGLALWIVPATRLNLVSMLAQVSFGTDGYICLHAVERVETGFDFGFEFEFDFGFEFEVELGFEFGFGFEFEFEFVVLGMQREVKAEM